MDEEISIGTSFDLSETSSVNSIDTEETDLISNVAKRNLENSPTEVTAYPGDEDRFMPHLGDPLPVVSEGKVLTEDPMLVEEALDSYAQYEKEEAEFAKEMNTTKISFSAYRRAVLHLVHHQHDKSKGFGKDEKEGSGEEDVADEDANQRMVILEETAKLLVETKAKACFEAVPVAKEFMEWREERKNGRNALLQEIATFDSTKEQAKAKPKPLSIPKLAQETDAKEPKKPVAVLKPKAKQNKKQQTKDENKTQTFVRRRKATRHPDCILSTLPKFQFRNESNTDERDDEEETPASYGTTSWIGNMVQWRAQRRKFKLDSLKRCGCPDCQTDLKKLSS